MMRNITTTRYLAPSRADASLPAILEADDERHNFMKISSDRPVTTITIHELRAGGPPLHRRKITDPWGKAFLQLDRVLHVYERRPIGWLRLAALRKIERWIPDRQEADGCLGGSRPP